MRAHRDRLDYLDSIRAVAAIAVVYLHGALWLTPSAAPFDRSIYNFFTNTIDIGKAGVVAFFMVSGFIIPVSLKANKPRAIALRDFFIGRVFRLYPIYWLSLVGAIYLCNKPCLRFERSVIFTNISMFQGFVGVRSMMGLYWTLQIEWIFYFVCALLFLLGSLGNPKRILTTYFVSLGISFGIAALRFHAHKAYPVAVFLGLCVMLSATLWHMVIVEGREHVRPMFYVALGSFVVAIPFISYIAYHNAEAGESWVRYTLTYWVAIAFFVLATSRFKMSWRPLAAVGRASFSLYLGNNYFRKLLERPLFENALIPISGNLFLLSQIAVSVICSLLLYRYFEEPFIRMGRRLIRSLNERNESRAVKEATEFV